MNPYFMAIGPIFKNNGTVEAPFDNIDIFPLVCQIMGLQTPGHNGTISNVLPLLANKPEENCDEKDPDCNSASDDSQSAKNAFLILFTQILMVLYHQAV
jgi:hypothetical protein